MLNIWLDGCKIGFSNVLIFILSNWIKIHLQLASSLVFEKKNTNTNWLSMLCFPNIDKMVNQSAMAKDENIETARVSKQTNNDNYWICCCSRSRATVYYHYCHHGSHMDAIKQIDSRASLHITNALFGNYRCSCCCCCRSWLVTWFT